MATKKYQITQLQQDDSLLVLHPESDADIVSYDNTNSTLTATEVQTAVDQLDAKIESLDTGVSDVKDVNNNSIVVNGVATLSKAAVGLGNLTNDRQVVGLASGTTNGDLVKFGADGYTVADAGVSVSTATPSSSSTDAQIPTAKAVYTAINNLPEPMIFKGSLGTGGTITTLPAASSANEGYVYKVITDGTYAGQAAKVGDTFISDGSTWVLIPSGDEPSGTVVSVGMTVPTGLSVSGSPITSSGTLAVSYASGYSIPTDANQTAWSAKYDKPSTGIPKTDLASDVQTSLGKADTALQGNQTITLSGDITGSGATAITTTLANSGITAGTYSAVQVNAKGLATSGGQIIEVGATSQATPSSDLVVGGIFFKEV